ncbi:MAG: response regulator [Magnetococcales bacterium]|nr:response regulator [Magnetococcales bacterium]
MQESFHGLFGGCQSPLRFLAGLTLLGMGETAITLLLPHAAENWATTGIVLGVFFGMTAWNLAIILIFFHLPLFRELINRQWLHTTHQALSDRMRQVANVQQLGEMTLKFLAENLQAINGVIYLNREENRLYWLAGIGTPARNVTPQTLMPGEGLLGQVAVTRMPSRIQEIPVEPLRIQAQLLETWPKDVFVTPLLHDGQLQGVLALGSRIGFNTHQLLFLEKTAETIARAIAGVQSNMARQQLLEESRKKTDELAINQQVLRGTIELLEQTSGFKSRFLANMSHELRSPLNSLLILAQLLQENKQGNLTPKQVEFASTIHAAGSDLLTLIDEILDLARIEAGRIRIFKDPVKISDLATSLERLFVHMAREKRLEFNVILKGPLPLAIRTDRTRVEQILKNLITNAIKFTHSGGVTVVFRQIRELDGERIAMSVADTGVGIPRDQHGEIFEPFRQLDDGANRKYGGTGLGLAICKELTQLLNGRIELISEEGKGSLFTLYLPLEHVETPLPVASAEQHHEERKMGGIDGIPDDRRRLGPDDRSVLLVGMDYHKIRALGESARSLGLSVIVAGDQSAALFLANFLRPMGVIIAGDLPGVTTLPMIKRLRTTAGRDRLPVLYLHPANASPSGDLSLEAIQAFPMLHGSNQTSAECQQFLQSLTTSSLAAGGAQEDLPPGQLQSALMTTRAPEFRPPECNLAGNRLLLIDDDIRNIFALTSLLEEKGCQVIMAENGRVALEILKRRPAIDMILVDIMMPDMNGYELLGEIRRQPPWREIPMLVITAKAMQGERQRCLNAGASDYLSKPLDTLKLLSMMRPWLDRNH